MARARDWRRGRAQPLYPFYPLLAEAPRSFAVPLGILSAQATPRLKDTGQPESIWITSRGGEARVARNSGCPDLSQRLSESCQPSLPGQERLQQRKGRCPAITR